MVSLCIFGVVQDWYCLVDSLFTWRSLTHCMWYLFTHTLVLCVRTWYLITCTLNIRVGALCVHFVH